MEEKKGRGGGGGGGGGCSGSGSLGYEVKSHLKIKKKLFVPKYLKINTISSEHNIVVTSCKYKYLSFSTKLSFSCQKCFPGKT